MRLLPRFAAGLSLVALLTAGAAAEAPASPLRLVPDSADLLLEVKNPRRLVETVTSLDALKQLEQFPSVKELLDSTTSRRYYQFLAYFEKRLGADRVELLDRLAGGGVVLATKFGPDPATALLVVQGKDEKLMKKFADTALDVIDQELARQGVNARPLKATYQGVETVRIGDFSAAVAGASLLVSNNEQALQAALDLYAGKSKKSMADAASVADAARLLPAHPLANLWINYDAVKRQKAVKEFYAVRLDIPGTIVFGTLADTLRRSPFVCAALCKEKDGLLLTVRMPRGRDGMGAIKSIYLAPEGQPGARPLLAPKDVLYSESFYMDPAPFWTDRAKLFSDQQIKSMEAADKNSGRFLSGLELSKLLTEAGPYQRFVAVEQKSAGYKTTPKLHVPAFAVVTEMRDPEAFGRHLETVLRGAALLALTRVKLKMTEETYKDCQITTYRFREDSPLQADVNDVRFNFTPSFARVGDQFVVASTVELCRDLVDEVQTEAKAPPAAASGVCRRFRLVSDGFADLAMAFEDSLVTQTILDQAVPPAEARAQVQAILQWIRGLGAVDAEEAYAADSFRFDVRWATKKLPAISR